MTKNRVTGIFALVLSVIYLAATSTIEITAVSDPIGPRVFPVIIGVGLFLIGLLLILCTKTEGDPCIHTDTKAHRNGCHQVLDGI